MRIADLRDRKVVVWGTGLEGRAAAAWIRRDTSPSSLFFVDEKDGPSAIDGVSVRRGESIASALNEANVIVKSPGVSLYHPLLQKARERSGVITSLLNLWFAEPRQAKTVCVTGTKGKSTTASLLAHTLNKLGAKTTLLGNIGAPATDDAGHDADVVVIEMSSYQAADFDGACDIGVLVSLYPEHLDWHGSLERYYGDKLNLLAHATTKVINNKAWEELRWMPAFAGMTPDDKALFNSPSSFHVHDGVIFEGEKEVGATQNRYLARKHNLANVCAVLAVIRLLGLEPAKALAAMEDFKGLPHRQQEIGEKDGILFVDDSISTTPQSAIAAMEVYRGKPITLIAGGYDRGIDYAPLVDYVTRSDVPNVICMGPSGQRIYDGLHAAHHRELHRTDSMAEAVALAKTHTPKGGIVLLSPAAPSYGLFKDFKERGKRFAEAV